MTSLTDALLIAILVSLCVLILMVGVLVGIVWERINQQRDLDRRVNATLTQLREHDRKSTS